MGRKGIGTIFIMLIASMALYIGVSAVVSTLVSFAYLGSGSADGIILKTTIVSTAVCAGFMFVWNLFLSKYFIDKSFTRENGNVSAGGMILLVAAAGLFSMALNSVFGIVSFFYHDTVYEGIAKGMTSGTVFEIVLCTVILAPILEEILFRGIFYAGFRSIFAYRVNEKKMVSLALVFSSLCFGIVHMNVSQFVYAFIMGILLGYIYEKTGKLYMSVIAHAVCNLLSAARIYNPLYTAVSQKISYLAADAAVLFAVAILLLLIFRRSMKNVPDKGTKGQIN